MQKKVEKMLHVLYKVDMCACYAKQKINLAWSPCNTMRLDIPHFKIFTNAIKSYT